VGDKDISRVQRVAANLGFTHSQSCHDPIAVGEAISQAEAGLQAASRAVVLAKAFASVAWRKGSQPNTRSFQNCTPESPENVVQTNTTKPCAPVQDSTSTLLFESKECANQTIRASLLPEQPATPQRSQPLPTTYQAVVSPEKSAMPHRASPLPTTYVAAEERLFSVLAHIRGSGKGAVSVPVSSSETDDVAVDASNAESTLPEAAPPCSHAESARSMGSISSFEEISSDEDPSVATPIEITLPMGQPRFHSSAGGVPIRSVQVDCVRSVSCDRVIPVPSCESATITQSCRRRQLSAPPQWASAVVSPRSSWDRLGSSRSRRLSTGDISSRTFGIPAPSEKIFQRQPIHVKAGASRSCNDSMPTEVSPNLELHHGALDVADNVCEPSPPWEEATSSDCPANSAQITEPDSEVLCSSLAFGEESGIDDEETFVRDAFHRHSASSQAVNSHHVDDIDVETGCRGGDSRDAACSPCATLPFPDLEKDNTELENENTQLRSQLTKAEADFERLTLSVDPMRRSFEAAISALRAEGTSSSRLHAEERERLQNQVSLNASEAQRLRLKMTHAQEESRRLRRALEEERHRNDMLERESRRPRQDTNYRQSSPLRKANSVATAETPQALAPVIARLELEALGQVDGEARAKLKRKLQLKWHPDKCINSILATCVMQELQQRPEWK